MKRRRPRVLCLDIEGGFGGSSRSLYYMVKHMDRSRYDFEVWCKRSGPIQERYRKIGVPCRVLPRMPKVSSLPKLSRNVYVFALAALDFLRARDFLRWSCREIQNRFDLVHFNHEALFFLAAWLRRRLKIPFVTHVRTMLRHTPFARLQYRMIARSSDKVIFISENERENFRALTGAAEGTVVFNIVEVPTSLPTPHPLIPENGRFKVANLSNYSWHRATDRLVDLARSLQRSGKEEILFVVAGDMRLPGSLPGELGRLARKGGTLEHYVKSLGLERFFLFLGYVPEAERVLAGCDIVLRPSRGKDPWGRDVIEAMAYGKPVIATGTYSKFVESGLNGYLFPEYDSEGIAGRVIYLSEHPEVVERMGEANVRKAKELFDGSANASKVAAVYDSLLRGRPEGRSP